MSAPSFTAYLPPRGKANDTGIIMLPGGGLRVLSVDGDMQTAIRRLNEEGVAVFVLKYRIRQGQPAPPPPPGAMPAPPPRFPFMEIRNANANPAPRDAELQKVLAMAVADTRKAMAMIRAEAAHWGIDPTRIGLMGTSAGGGVAIGTLLAQPKEERPLFIASLYGPALQDVTVPSEAPPLFLATHSNHGAVTDGLVALVHHVEARRAFSGIAQLRGARAPVFRNALARPILTWLEPQIPEGH